MNSSPIFCDRCSSFAMAQLDGEILCTRCLLAAIDSCGEVLEAGDVRPLAWVEPEHAPAFASTQE